MSAQDAGYGHHRSRSSIFRPFKPLTTINDNDRSSVDTSSSSTGRFRRGHLSRSSGTISSLGSQHRQGSIGSGSALGPLSTQVDPARQSSSQDSNPPSPTPGSPASGSARPSLTLSRRSIFGSIRGLRHSEPDENTPPGSAASTPSRASSFHWRDLGPGSSKDDHIDLGKNRTVLYHAEVVTNSSLFWKKREYLVLTETHLVRFKSQGKAAEIFHSISPYPGRSSSVRQSVVIPNDEASSLGDSGERATAIPLERIIAAFPPFTEEARPVPTLEIHYLENEHAACLTLQLADITSRDAWLHILLWASNRARLTDIAPIPPKLLEYAARCVEREQDYDRANFLIYKVVRRAHIKVNGDSSTNDETAKITGTACFLVIGLHKIHLIPLPKSSLTSGPASVESREIISFGVLSLSWLLVRADDDTFDLGYRVPFQKPVEYQLACPAASDIASRLRRRYAYLTPLWQERPVTFVTPGNDDDTDDEAENDDDQSDFGYFDRTLMAFCACSGVNAHDIRYAVNFDVEDAPQLRLLPPNKKRKYWGSGYSAEELMAVLKSLRYNQYFQSISFANISFDPVHDLQDHYDKEDLYAGQSFNEAVSWPTGWKPRSNLIIREIRALAMTNIRLRRLDFSGCLKQDLPGTVHFGSYGSEGQAPCCDFIEALSPLCKTQSTNVDWLILNDIRLYTRDVDFLLEIIRDRSSHLRGLELNNSKIGAELTDLVLDAIGTHSSTLEVFTLSRSGAALSPPGLAYQLAPLGFLRKLDLSFAAFAGSELPLLPFDVLSSWRLEALRLRNVPLNIASVEEICRYLNHRQSEVLRSLDLRNCSLNGFHVSDIMQSLQIEPDTARMLHLDISENPVEKGHDAMVAALKDHAPTTLSLRRTIYDHEDSLRKLLLSLANNRSIRKLDLARLSAPSEASPETIAAFEHFFIHNQTMEELDLTGEQQTRLDPSKLGDALRQSFRGLKQNQTLQVLLLNNQKLGSGGIVALADVLKENMTLRHVYCEHKEVKLHDLTDLVNAASENQTVLSLGDFRQGREQALRLAEQEILKDRTKSASATNLRPADSPSLRRAFTSLTLTSPNAKESKAGRALTEQDAVAALNILRSKWDEQIRRLDALLQRNARLHAGLPLDADINVQSTHDNRPATADSIDQIFRQVKEQTTPTAEFPSPSPTTYTIAPLRKETSGRYREPPESPRRKSSSRMRSLRPSMSSLKSKTSSSRTGPPPLPVGRSYKDSSTPTTPVLTIPPNLDIQIDTTPIFEEISPFSGLRISNPDAESIYEQPSPEETSPNENENANENENENDNLTPSVSPSLTRGNSARSRQDSTDDAENENENEEDEGLMMAKSPPRHSKGREELMGLGLRLVE